MKISYLYLPDPTNPHRVITLARMFDDKQDIMRVALAVNMCEPSYKVGYPKPVTVPGYPTDMFDKVRGRSIATERLAKGKNFYYEVQIDRNVDVPAVVQMLQGLMAKKPHIRGFRRCAKQKLLDMWTNGARARHDRETVDVGAELVPINRASQAAKWIGDHA